MAGALQLMMGSAGGLVVPLPGGNVVDFQTNPTNPSLFWEFRADGTVYSDVVGASPLFRHRWYNPGGNTNLYVRFVHPGSGVAPNSGTLNTWQQMTVTRSFGLSRSTIGIDTGSVTVQFSADQSTVLSSGVYSYTAEKDSGA